MQPKMRGQIRGLTVVSVIAAVAAAGALVARASSAAPLRAAGCIVPKVGGDTLAAAETTIRRRGCSVGAIHYAFSGRVKRGRVLSQRPWPGAHRRGGIKVALTVSKGPKLLPAHVRMKLKAASPEGTVGAFGSVWVSNHDLQHVSRLDPNTGKTTAKLPAGDSVGWPVAGADAVWAIGYSGSITRIDPTTNQASTFDSPFSSLCGLSAATPGALWVDECGDAGFKASLHRISASTHKVTASVAVGNGVDSMVPVGNTVWAATYSPSQILRFDATTGAVQLRIPVKGCPMLMQTSYAYGYLWVGQRDGDDTQGATCTGEPNILRIDPSTGAVREISVGRPAWVATGDGSVWTAVADKTGQHQVISRIDPNSLTSTTWTKLPMKQQPYETQPDGFAFQDHALWVGAFADSVIWVVNTQ